MPVSRNSIGQDASPKLPAWPKAAAAFTLIETAKLNGIDPQAYLSHVLTNIADYPINKIANLLPWNVELN